MPSLSGSRNLSQLRLKTANKRRQQSRVPPPIPHVPLPSSKPSGDDVLKYLEHHMTSKDKQKMAARNNFGPHVTVKAYDNRYFPPTNANDELKKMIGVGKGKNTRKRHQRIKPTKKKKEKK